MDGAFTVSLAGQAVLSFATVLFVTSSPRFQTGFPLSRGESMRTGLLCNPPFQMKAIPEDGAVLRTGTGPGPLFCWCLGPVQVPTLSISWHHPAPPPRQQNLLCKGYFLYTFFFLRNYLPTWSSALRENRANSLIEGSCATGHFLMRG